MKIKIILIVGLILCFVLYKVGDYIPHHSAPADKFIGQIGNTYFYNYTSEKISSNDLHEFWFFRTSGAPGPFAAFDRFKTRRVDIVDMSVKHVNYGGGDVCLDGFYTTNEYSFFNIQTWNSLRTHTDCA